MRLLVDEESKLIWVLKIIESISNIALQRGYHVSEGQNGTTGKPLSLSLVIFFNEFKMNGKGEPYQRRNTKPINSKCVHRYWIRNPVSRIHISHISHLFDWQPNRSRVLPNLWQISMKVDWSYSNSVSGPLSSWKTEEVNWSAGCSNAYTSRIRMKNAKKLYFFKKDSFILVTLQ